MAFKSQSPKPAEPSLFAQLRVAAREGKAFTIFGASCGIWSLLFLFLGFPGGNFLPPLHPDYTPAQTVRHYIRFESGVKAMAALMQFVGFFYPIYAATISGQISRIPGVSKAVVYSQLIGGTLGGLLLCLPGYFFATTVFRLDRPAEITQALSDLSWLLFAMPFPSLIAQDLAFSVAVLRDRRPNPLFPRWFAYTSTGATLAFWPSIACHLHKTGPVAWNGALAFWVGGICGGIQINMMVYFLLKAIVRKDIPADGSVEVEKESTSEESISCRDTNKDIADQHKA